MINEILPGVLHWTAVHERIHIDVSSYYFEEDGILLDPMVPIEGLDWFSDHVLPNRILLSNRHHYRHSTKYQEAFGCTVWCHQSGLYEFTKGEMVNPFEFGHEFPSGIVAMEVASLCPEETAYHIPSSVGLIAFADGLVRDGDGPLSFVPDRFMGEDPEGVKRGLKEAFCRLLDCNFDHLLFAHGNPWIGRGKEALKQFVEEE